MATVSSLNPGTFARPGVYEVVIPAAPVTPTGPNTSLICVRGTSSWGAFETPIYATAQSAAQQIGDDDTDTHSMLMAAANGSAPEGQNFVFCRAGDGTQTTATLSMPDAGTAASGGFLFGGTASVSGTLTVTLTPASGSPVSVPITITASESTSACATALAAAINSSAAVTGANAFIANTTASGSNVPIKAAVVGTGGNSISITGATLGSLTCTPTSPTTLTGGGYGVFLVLTAVNYGSYGNNIKARCDLVSGTTSLNPVYQVTIYAPKGQAQTFVNIPGYATLGGAYNAAAFQANVVAAINSATSGSAWVTASAGSSTVPPGLGVVTQASGGTNGYSGVTSAILLGVDGTTGRTGIYVFENIVPGGTFYIAGLNDPTLGPSMATFGRANRCIGVLNLVPRNSTTLTAISNIQGNNLPSRYLVGCMDYSSVYDPYQGQTVWVSPEGPVAGVIASLNPWDCPLNKPVAGKSNMLNTERTISTAQPLNDAEIIQRTQNNICFLTNQAPGLTGFQLMTGKGGCALDGTPIADTRMLNVISIVLEQIGGPYVGKSQSVPPQLFAQGQVDTDPTRREYRDAINAYLNTLLDADYISAFSVAVDFTNNNFTTVTQGFLIATVEVQTLAGISYVLNIVQVGSTVQVQTPTSLLTAA